jgi:hypothetical protein
MKFVINIKIEIQKKFKYECNSVNTEYRTQVYVTRLLKMSSEMSSVSGGNSSWITLYILIAIITLKVCDPKAWCQ